MEEFVVPLSPEEELVREIIEPLLDSEGYELVRIRLRKVQAKSQLTLFVDTRDRQNGIVMENLSDISHLLSDVLDASFEDGSVLRGRYDLEVSSPGLDRPLCKRSHFSSAIGEKIKAKRKNNADTHGMKNFIGKLLEATDDGIVVEPEQKDASPISIPYEDLAEAHIIFDFAKK